MAEDHGPIGTFSYEIILNGDRQQRAARRSTSVNLPVAADTIAAVGAAGLVAPLRSARARSIWAGPRSTDNVGRGRLPGRALPGRRLHELRPGRHAHHHHLHRHRPGALDHLQLPGPGGRRLRQPRCATPPSPRPPPAPRPPTPPGLVAGLGVRCRAPAPRPPMPPAMTTPGTITGATWTTQGKLRQRPELQRHEQPRPGRRLGFAEPDHGDDPVGLDPADGEPERLAHDHAARDRRLLPERQQQQRTAAPVGRRHPRRHHPVRSAARRPIRSTPGPTWPSPTTAPPCGSTSTAPRSPAAPRPAPIQTTDNPLWIGGNSPYGEYFQGLIDEVRVYNRALTQAEIQSRHEHIHRADRARHHPALGPDRADGDRRQRQPDQPELDGLHRQRRRHRLPGRALPGRGLHELRPGRRRRPATTFSDTGLAPSTTYSYRVRAVDAAGNLERLFRRSPSATTGAASATPPGLVGGLRVRRGSRHDHRRCLRQREHWDPDRGQLDDPGHAMATR